jgi:membrane-associated phospholipid phosphatase
VNHQQTFRLLLCKSLAALVVASVLVILCYYFVDRPVSRFVHDHEFAKSDILKSLTFPPTILQDWSPLLIAALMLRRAWGPLRRWQQVLLTASVTLILADQFRESLAVVFGRYWPETWVNNNPSFINNDKYGFHFFQSGSWYRSFPSGHTARTVAVAAVVWIAYPNLRWLCILASVIEGVALIGMNYHFVGDVVGGGFLGGVVGAWIYACANDSVNWALGSPTGH